MNEQTVDVDGDQIEIKTQDIVECQYCEHTWTSRDEKARLVCPNCEYEIPRKVIRQEYITYAKWRWDGLGSVEDIISEMENSIARFKTLSRYGWSVSDKIQDGHVILEKRFEKPELPEDASHEVVGGDETVPTPYQLFTEQRKAIDNAQNKKDAREAIEPVLGSLMLYGRLPENRDMLGDGGPYPSKIADLTPLTESEVATQLENITWDFLEDVANEES
jgi:predicted RNA-binding Zn-ribbon protein involved in translation (DUF1610 family)